MLISKSMNAALNEQVGNEFLASLQYVAIASYFSEEGLTVLAAHFFKQSEEEREHALRFVHFILEAGGHVSIPDISAPEHLFKSAREAVELALTHEKRVTDQINRLVDLALKEGDHISKNMLDWFVREQLEEVSSMDTLLKVVTRAGENNLLFVEQYLLQNKKSPKAESESEES
jgi:bacterioferritin B